MSLLLAEKYDLAKRCLAYLNCTFVGGYRKLWIEVGELAAAENNELVFQHAASVLEKL